MQNLSHCTGTLKNGLYGFNKKLSHCTWTGTGKNISIHHRAHFQDLKNGYQTHSSGPENVPGLLPCSCSGAVWKVLIKTIQPILPGPCPCPGPGSRPSQCEYTLTDTGAEFYCAPLASSGGGRRPETVPINIKVAILAFTLSIANINNKNNRLFSGQILFSTMGDWQTGFSLKGLSLPCLLRVMILRLTPSATPISYVPLQVGRWGSSVAARRPRPSRYLRRRSPFWRHFRRARRTWARTHFRQHCGKK